jgi:hypothetical protein
MAIASHSSGPLPNPIAKRITSEHIDKLLSNSSKEEEHRHSQYLHRNYTWLAVLVVLLAFLMFCILKIEDADLVKMIVATVFGFLAGGLGGFGLGRATRWLRQVSVSATIPGCPHSPATRALACSLMPAKAAGPPVG